MTRTPSSASSTLEGLRSRCTKPTRWMSASAVASPAANRRTVSWGRVPPQASRASLSEGPGTNTEASQGVSASGSASRTGAVQAPDTSREAVTSLRNRARKPSSSAYSAWICLTATSRPSRPVPSRTLPIPLATARRAVGTHQLLPGRAWLSVACPRYPSSLLSLTLSGSRRRSGQLTTPSVRVLRAERARPRHRCRRPVRVALPCRRGWPFSAGAGAAGAACAGAARA